MDAKAPKLHLDSYLDLQTPGAHRPSAWPSFVRARFVHRIERSTFACADWRVSMEAETQQAQTRRRALQLLEELAHENVHLICIPEMQVVLAVR
jgi:hypothetical protein